jgi:hypothetical protein
VQSQVLDCVKRICDVSKKQIPGIYRFAACRFLVYALLISSFVLIRENRGKKFFPKEKKTKIFSYFCSPFTSSRDGARLRRWKQF